MPVTWKTGILTKRIPQGGFGRSLTRLECTRLRTEYGLKLSQRWIVVRYADRPDLGILYDPSAQGHGYDHARIYVSD